MKTLGYENLRLEIDGGVLRVLLDRPRVHNALNPALIGEITSCFEEAARDDEVRVVVLSGEGRSFCAGADVGYMRQTARFSHEENVEDARRLAAMYRAIDRCPKPVVGRVFGAVVGGGCGLVASCDLVVAAEDAWFAFTEVRLGISPATIAPFVVRKIGISHARELFLSGSRFDAGRAREIGLVHEVSSAEALDEATERAVSRLLKGGPRALAATKELLRELEEHPEEATERMAGWIARLRGGEEGQEGLGAFLEKREPAWREEVSR